MGLGPRFVKNLCLHSSHPALNSVSVHFYSCCWGLQVACNQKLSEVVIGSKHSYRHAELKSISLGRESSCTFVKPFLDPNRSFGRQTLLLEPGNATNASVESRGTPLPSPGASATNDPALDPHRVTGLHRTPWTSGTPVLTMCNRHGMMQI